MRMRTTLRPEPGREITIGGVTFHLLFTFAVVDELQEFFGAPISEVIMRMTDNMTVYSAAGRILHALISSDLYNHGEPDNVPSYEDIMHVLDLKDAKRIVSAIMTSYGIDMPEPDDDEEDEERVSEQINIARLLVIGKTELHMTEDEFWKTTPRKYFKLFDEYIHLKGGKNENDGGIDALP